MRQVAVVLQPGKVFFFIVLARFVAPRGVALSGNLRGGGLDVADVVQRLCLSVVLGHRIAVLRREGQQRTRRGRFCHRFRGRPALVRPGAVEPG